ncbi:MAG TPA: hypothetical protein VMV56_07730 [Williamwhitmania sp.]|nr:hypothetical protein [Williamwhitmania sp.]
MKIDKRKQTGEIAEMLLYFDKNQNWITLASEYRCKYGYDLIVSIINWIKKVGKTKAGIPTENMGKGAYPYLRKIFEKPYWNYINAYIKKEHIEDMEVLGRILFKETDSIIQEIEPCWVVALRKRLNLLLRKRGKNIYDFRAIQNIKSSIINFGFKL